MSSANGPQHVLEDVRALQHVVDAGGRLRGGGASVDMILRHSVQYRGSLLGLPILVLECSK